MPRTKSCGWRISEITPPLSSNERQQEMSRPCALFGALHRTVRWSAPNNAQGRDISCCRSFEDSGGVISEIRHPQLFVLGIVGNAGRILDHRLGALENPNGCYVAICIRAVNRDEIRGVIGNKQLAVVAVYSNGRGPIHLSLRPLDHANGSRVSTCIEPIHRNGSRNNFARSWELVVADDGPHRSGVPPESWILHGWITQTRPVSRCAPVCHIEQMRLGIDGD